MAILGCFVSCDKRFLRHHPLIMFNHHCRALLLAELGSHPLPAPHYLCTPGPGIAVTNARRRVDTAIGVPIGHGLASVSQRECAAVP